MAAQARQDFWKKLRRGDVETSRRNRLVEYDGRRLRPRPPAAIWIRPTEVLDAIQTAYEGTTGSQIYEGNRRFECRRDSGRK